MTKLITSVILFMFIFNFTYSLRSVLTDYELSKTVESDFFIKILDKAYVTKRDAIYFFNMVLFKESNVRTKKLIQYKILKKNDTKNVNSAISKGLLAQFIVRLLKLENKDLGFIIFKTNRYAYRICNDYGIFNFTRGNASQYITGVEIMGIMKRLETMVIRS